MHALPTLPVALSIAGSDNSAGAGIQADLKTFTALGTFGLTAVTCVVAEIPGLVDCVAPVPADNVARQIALCFQAYPVAAAKTGMLFSSEIIECVAGELGAARAAGKRFHLVVDPVMVASSGDPLLEDGAVGKYISQLFPLASLLTPNLDEAAVLLGSAIRDEREMVDAAAELFCRFGVPILLKGGHLRSGTALDLLVTAGGSAQRFEAPFIPGASTHGTGCTYAAAITAGLALGKPLAAAVSVAKGFVTHAIQTRIGWPGTSVTALNQSNAT